VKFEVDATVERPGGFRLQVRLEAEAEALGLVGPSGSGKSTLLDAVAGIEPGARVRLDGEDLSALPLHRRRIGHVAQDPLLFPHLSVQENLAYSPSAGPPAAVARALGIEPLLERMPRHLSGGERRRAALARAVVSRPRVLLLDEPFAGLDEPRRREALSLLDHVRREFGIPMILVSHRADEVIGLTDRTARLEAGRLTACGPSAALLQAGETRVDNFLTGRVVGPRRVEVEGVELTGMLPEEAAGRVRVACYAHDVLLAAAPPSGLSARNCVPVRVAAVIPAGEAALVELARPALRALVTAEAVRSLGLVPGAELFAVLKATSLVYLGPA
jgi:molybdate transport system ATP-binding protein